MVFTHKEVSYFYRNHRYFQPYQSPKERIKKLVLPEQDKEAKHAQQVLKRINDQYFVGIHFGWAMERFPDLDYIDFCMSSPTGVTFDEAAKYQKIPLNSSNFTPAHFYTPEPKKHLKMWDVLMVSRDARFKNLDKFLASVRQLYDSGRVCDVLLIVQSNKNFDTHPGKVYTELLDDYQRLFNADERDHFTILKLHPNIPFPGISSRQIARFCHLSKVFALFSEQEGGSKAISEALLSGLAIVAKSDLQGGGRDSLNARNSVLFDDFDSAHTALAKALDQWKALNADHDALVNDLHEERSLARLEEEFEKLFQSRGLHYSEELLNTDRLGKRLPAHWLYDLPWVDERFESPDIKCLEQLNLFVKELDL